MQDYLIHFVDAIGASIPNILIALLIFIASLYVARLLGKLLRKVLQKREAASGVIQLLEQVIYWTIVVFGAITALQRFFNVTAFLAGLGILGFTVGFALQNIMQNFAAGVILLIQQPFQVGDAISAANYDGTILAIDLRTTEMKTFDGRIVILPNADVLSSAIVNYTRANRRRVELPVGVSYDSDPEQVRKLALDVVRAVPGYVEDPAPLVIFHTFGGSSVDFTAYFWIDTAVTNPFLAKDDALIRVKAAFEKQNVEIPFPIQTILLPGENQNPA